MKSLSTDMPPVYFEEAGVIYSARRELEPGWVQAVAAALPVELDPSGYEWLTDIVETYTDYRSSMRHAVSWPSIFKRLNQMADALNLLQEVFIEYPVDTEMSESERQVRIERLLVLERLEDELHVSRDRNPFPNLIAVLSAACEKARSRAVEEHSLGKCQRKDEGFRWLIKQLADFYELKTGSQPTASKDYGPNLSPFVKFVWEVMTAAVPADLREHSASSAQAMANAISDVLKSPDSPVRSGVLASF